MDMWKPFRNSTQAHAPNAAILFDKFHVLRHLGEALDKIRKTEYARVTGNKRTFIKGQKYVLLSHRENLTSEGRQSLKLLLKANKRLNTAYILRESFDQLWTTVAPFRETVFLVSKRESHALVEQPLPA
jgi:transposase